VQLTLRAVVLLATTLALSACQRKAPGPVECHEFALRAAGVRSESIARVDPRLRRMVEDITVRCLTTPFDRQLLTCARDPADLRPCFAEFQARHPERAERELGPRN
jgi:hypothetical protein